MKLLTILLLIYSDSLVAQITHSLQLGDSIITFVEKNNASKSTILFLNVHENEATSIQSINDYDQSGKYRFVYLSHHATRRIGFNHKQEVYTVDPNRIFSQEGIESTLAYDSICSRKAEKLAKQLANEILNYVFKSSWIISLHNNTENNYSILSYLPDSSEAINAKDLYINEKMDPDDFIYTTDFSLFQKLKGLQINVILQDNENCINDGSLSVYCGKRGIPYANVEAEHGHLAEQIKLIAAVVSIIEVRANSE